MNWKGVYVVAGLSTIPAALVHLIYKALIKQAQTMGIAASPRVNA